MGLYARDGSQESRRRDGFAIASSGFGTGVVEGDWVGVVVAGLELVH